MLAFRYAREGMQPCVGRQPFDKRRRAEVAQQQRSRARLDGFAARRRGASLQVQQIEETGEGRLTLYRWKGVANWQGNQQVTRQADRVAIGATDRPAPRLRRNIRRAI